MAGPYTSGNEIIQEVIVLDTNSNPLGGLTGGSGAGGFASADFSVVLTRISGSTTEVVTMAEGVAAGHYNIRYTPTATGGYLLHLKELNVNTLGRTIDFYHDVVTAGSIFVPSLANAFCSEADVERWLQQSITATTKPSSTELAAFAETRAAWLQSLCASKGFAVTPSTVTNGSRLQDLLREANAIGAACDCTSASAFGVAPSRTDKAEWLEAQWDRYVGRPAEPGKPGIIGIVEMEIRGNLASLATDHILSGDTAPAVTSGTAPTDVGIQFTMDSSF